MNGTIQTISQQGQNIFITVSYSSGTNTATEVISFNGAQKLSPADITNAIINNGQKYDLVFNNIQSLGLMAGSVVTVDIVKDTPIGTIISI